MESPVELPEDMVRKILTKLPVTTLVRFSCVCKLWRDFVVEIKNPKLLHLENPNSFCNDQPTMVFLRENFPKAANKDSLLSHKVMHALAPPEEDDPLLKVNSACNGIVCLASHDTYVVHLYNPITAEVLKLPPSLLTYKEEAKELGFGHILGFGFDASCNDYKIIRIIRHGFCFDQEIYRLSTRCWSKLELDYDYTVHQNHDAGVAFFNGSFHWPIIRRMIDGWHHDVGARILTFNFQTEKLGEMQYPDLKNQSCRFLTEMDGSLTVCSYYDKLLQVWVMREYGEKESWTKTFSVHLPVPIRSVLSVRVHNMRLFVLGAYYTDSGEGRFGWREEGGECSAMFEAFLSYRSSWAVFRPSLVSLSQQAR